MSNIDLVPGDGDKLKQKILPKLAHRLDSSEEIIWANCPGFIHMWPTALAIILFGMLFGSIAALIIFENGAGTSIPAWIAVGLMIGLPAAGILRIFTALNRIQVLTTKRILVVRKNDPGSICRQISRDEITAVTRNQQYHGVTVRGKSGSWNDYIEIEAVIDPAEVLALMGRNQLRSRQ